MCILEAKKEVASEANTQTHTRVVLLHTQPPFVWLRVCWTLTGGSSVQPLTQGLSKPVSWSLIDSAAMCSWLVQSKSAK